MHVDAVFVGGVQSKFITGHVKVLLHVPETQDMRIFSLIV
jgi:hypothetical protein